MKWETLIITIVVAVLFLLLFHEYNFFYIFLNIKRHDRMEKKYEGTKEKVSFFCREWILKAKKVIFWLLWNKFFISMLFLWNLNSKPLHCDRSVARRIYLHPSQSFELQREHISKYLWGSQNLMPSPLTLSFHSAKFFSEWERKKLKFYWMKKNSFPHSNLYKNEWE